MLEKTPDPSARAMQEFIAVPTQEIERSMAQFWAKIQHDSPFARAMAMVTALPESMARFQAAIKTIGDHWEAASKAIADHWEAEMRPMLDRFNAAKDLPPNHPAKAAWAFIGHLTPKAGQPLWRRLPSPFSRGHPKGKGSVVSDKTLLDQMTILVAAGKKPTTAAREVLKSRSHDGIDLKGKADHLVRLFKKRAF
jgi:hypothetical protein